MFNRRLPWLVVLPLVAAGSVVAHAVGRVLLPGAGSQEFGHREAGELAGLHARTSHGLAGHTVLWLGLLAAVISVAVIHSAAARLGVRRRRGLGSGLFFSLPLIAYSSQELIERRLHAESFPFHAVFEPRFLLGLALQLPFATATLALGWLLLRAGKHVVRLLAARRSPAPSTRLPQGWARSAPLVPRVCALSRGHPLRGPPLLA